MDKTETIDALKLSFSDQSAKDGKPKTLTESEAEQVYSDLTRHVENAVSHIGSELRK